MRLVLVHGINQEGKSEDAIRTDWIDALEDALGMPGSIERKAVVAPFYGDVLATLTAGGSLDQMVAQGLAADDEEAAFVTAGLLQMALDAGLTQEQIASEEQVVAQGLPHDRRFIAILRLLDGLSSTLDGLALRLLKQAYAYLKQPHIMKAVDDIVRPVLAEGPCIVVGHSLGTVVSFKLLRELGQTVPLYMTLGSPLAITSVQTALRKPRRVPAGVSRWFNALDPDDFVTLGRPLTAETFAAGIENRTDIENGDDAHAIGGYLRDPVVSRMIADAVIDAH